MRGALCSEPWSSGEAGRAEPAAPSPPRPAAPPPPPARHPPQAFWIPSGVTAVRLGHNEAGRGQWVTSSGPDVRKALDRNDPTHELRLGFPSRPFSLLKTQLGRNACRSGDPRTPGAQRGLQPLVPSARLSWGRGWGWGTGQLAARSPANVSVAAWGWCPGQRTMCDAKAL